MEDDDKERPAADKRTVKEWVGVALLFLAAWFLMNTYRPQSALHFLKWGIVLLLYLALYAVARRFLSSVQLSVLLALSVAFAFLLLFAVPHHAAVAHPPPTTRFGKVAAMVGSWFGIIVWVLIVVSVLVAIAGAGARRWFAARLPFLADISEGIMEGIIPTLLLLTFAEIVWRLTA